MSDGPSKHVLWSEVRCRCGCGLGTSIGHFEDGLFDMFEALREIRGHPLIITSGARCRARNAAVGGSPNSSHVPRETDRGAVKCAALDIACTPEQRYGLVWDAMSAGFKRIVIEPGCVHIDIDPLKPSPVLSWWAKE